MKQAETVEDTDIPTPDELFNGNYKIPEDSKEQPTPVDARSILTAPIPDEESSEETTEIATRNYLSISAPLHRKQNIDHAVRNLRSIANDSMARDADRISAAKVLLEASGAIGKGTNVNIIKSENTQINQNPEQSEHLLNAFSNIKKVLDASDANIKIQTGGKGV